LSPYVHALKHPTVQNKNASQVGLVSFLIGEVTAMKKQTVRLVSLVLAVVLTSLISITALAQNGNGGTHPVEGSYNAAISSSELGTVNFILILKKDSDKWTAEVKDSPLPLTASQVTVDADNNVIIIVDAGGMKAELKGKFDAGKLKGTWTAGEMKGTLEAAKKDDAKPAVVAAPVAAATGGASTAGLEGTYDAKVAAEGIGETPLTLVIKRDGDKLKTEVAGGGDLNIVEIKVDGDNVTLVATYQGQGPIMLPGKRNGDEMGGKWEFGGVSGTWKAKKK
jgi:hypothetical protein